MVMAGFLGLANAQNSSTTEGHVQSATAISRVLGDGRTITKCGVTISSEARNIVHWRAVDNEGKVIDEQKF